LILKIKKNGLQCLSNLSFFFKSYNFSEKTLKNILSKDKDKKYPENLEF